MAGGKSRWATVLWVFDGYFLPYWYCFVEAVEWEEARESSLLVVILEDGRGVLVFQLLK